MSKLLIVSLMIAVLLVGCGAPKKTGPAPADTAGTATPQPPGLLKDTLISTNLPEKLFITILVKDFGKIKVEMYTKDAPLNVTNVANLAIKGFYNGLTFHRIEPGFVVQGGDPKGDGTGGPGYTVPAEIKRKHEKGAMAMARLPDQVNPNLESSGSQFYFCLQPLPQLDGKYTVIGKIVEGMEVLEKIGQVRPPVVMERVFVTTE
ncbi:MAG: peptidylprolyl isomerase [candidate division WOR-3 bacterium]